MTDDKDAPVAQFKVGDRVRTRKNLKYQTQFEGDKAEEFTVTKVNANVGQWSTKTLEKELGNFYYDGDTYGTGVWEGNLRLVANPGGEPAPAPRFSVGDKVRVKYGKHTQSELSGEVFTISSISDYYVGSQVIAPDFWYEGDIAKHGVWERNLEPVLNLAPQVTYNTSHVTTFVTDEKTQTELDAIVEPSEDLANYHYLVIEALKAQVDIMDQLMTAIRAELLSANDVSQDTIATYKLGILHQVRREQMSYERLIVDVENMYNDMLEGN